MPQSRSRRSRPVVVLWEKYKGEDMIDPDVSRLRRLRAAALRVRAIARALSSRPYALNDFLLGRGAGASWRIARAVSGRLKAHPYASYQQDAGFGQQLCDKRSEEHTSELQS